MECEKFSCLVFGVLDHYLIAYSGHFIVDKDHLYDPIKKVPVNEVKLTDFNLCKFSIFNYIQLLLDLFY